MYKKTHSSVLFTAGNTKCKKKNSSGKLDHLPQYNTAFSDTYKLRQYKYSPETEGFWIVGNTLTFSLFKILLRKIKAAELIFQKI